MAEKKYILSYGDVVVCDHINLDDALLLIEALCRRYYRESSHQFQLVEDVYGMCTAEVDENNA